MDSNDRAAADEADAQDITRAANERAATIARGGIKQPKPQPWPDEKPAR